LRQLLGQGGRELALGLQRLAHLGPAGFELAGPAERVLQRAQLDLVKPAGLFLPVAGQEGDRVAAVEEGDGLGDGLRRQAEFAGEGRGQVGAAHVSGYIMSGAPSPGLAATLSQREREACCWQGHLPLSQREREACCWQGHLPLSQRERGACCWQGYLPLSRRERVPTRVGEGHPRASAP
jgi:hypothetical protein